MNEYFTLTSSVGRFVFYKGTPLSLAKLIRDSVVGQIWNPKPGSRRIKNSKDVYAYVRGLSDQLKVIPFEWQLV